MDFDEILERIGSFGRFQICHFLLSSFGIMASSAHTLANVYIAPTASFRCAQGDAPQTENENSTQAPPAPFQCNYLEILSNGSDALNVTVPCTEWVYDRSVFHSTIVTKWDLVCSDAGLKALSASLYMLGGLLGLNVFSWISDSKGRRFSVWSSAGLTIVAGIAAPFAPWFWLFVLIRLLDGAGCLGIYVCLWLLVVEMVGVRHRTLVGMLAAVFYAIGYMVVALVGFFIRDFSSFLLAIGLITGLPTAVSCFFLWESPRWLLARGDVTRGKAVLRKVAHVNRREFPEDLLFKETLKVSKGVDAESEPESKNYTWVDLMRHRNLRLLTIHICFNWLVHVLVYYGLMLGVADLSGNPYINLALSGVLEIPAYIGGMYLMDKVGRRATLVGLLILSGVSCITIPIVPSDLGWLVTALSMLGKFFITASFGLIYVYTAEMYPTVVRTSGLGIGALTARTAAIAAPYFADLGNLAWKPLPQLIFGIMSLVAGVLSLLFPETLNRGVPQTMMEGEKAAKMGFPRYCCHPTSAPEEKQSVNG